MGNQPGWSHDEALIGNEDPAGSAQNNRIIKTKQPAYNFHLVAENW